MSRYVRPKVNGATVFFTVCLSERGSSLLIDRLHLLRAAVRETWVQRPFRIDACVVLPDHLHMVWTLPVDDPDYSVRWGAIKSRFTRALRAKGVVGWNPTLPPGSTAVPAGRVGFEPTRSPNKIKKGDAGIWQRRFWEHHLMDAEDHKAHVEYCWLNPVKHGLVQRPADWVPSSIHRDIRLGRAVPDWSGVEPAGRFGEVA